jgi:electron transport complex protein RnfC
LLLVEVFKSGKFRGGVHPLYSKLTADQKIKRAKLPSKVILPLHQHVGAPCDPLVDKGEHVKTGQKIADSKAPVSAPVHASVSGVVTDVSPVLTPLGKKVLSVVIESDEKDEWVKANGIDPEKSTKEEIIAKVRECGIVGLGGAAFPTHIKLNPPKPVNTLIINGAECEPYITADHRLMLEEGEKIIEGARLIARVLGVEKTIIAVEDNKPDALKKMRELGDGMQVVSLPTKYPQGDERHLIKAVLGKEIPAGGLPFDVGVIVQNVGTAKAVRDAVHEGIPLVERVVTVTGDLRDPQNLLVRIGTPFSQLLEECGRPMEGWMKLIAGGPMMGIAQSEDVPVIKGTNCVLIFSGEKLREEEEQPCIRCGRCIRACPMGLVPTVLFALARRRMFEMCRDHYITSCDECGCCGYVCPSKIPLVQIIKRGKAAVLQMRKGGT